MAPDCDLHSSSDRWYFGAILATCIGLVFPPLFAVTALCVYKAKKCRKGGKE
nr:MAG TPA: dystroglycan [Caudoviricetes sp.]